MALAVNADGLSTVFRPLRQFRLDASEGLIGRQLQLFEFAFVEVPDFGLQRRLRNGSHLESQCDGVLGWATDRG
jgi:hypothetical protein